MQATYKLLLHDKETSIFFFRVGTQSVIRSVAEPKDSQILVSVVYFIKILSFLILSSIKYVKITDIYITMYKY